MYLLGRIKTFQAFLFLFFLPAFLNAQPVRGVAGDLWADKILGQFDFSEIKFNEANAQNLFNPTSVFVDNLHNILYLWDSGNNRLLAVHNLSTAVNGQGADMVLGQPDFIHTSCNGDSNWQTFNWAASPTGFYSPQILPNNACFCGQSYVGQSPAESWSTANMAIDSQGDIYVPDYSNNRVLRFDYPISTHQAASHVWGQLDGSSNERFDYQANNNNGSNVSGSPSSRNWGSSSFPTGTTAFRINMGRVWPWTGGTTFGWRTRPITACCDSPTAAVPAGFRPTPRTWCWARRILQAMGPTPASATSPVIPS